MSTPSFDGITTESDLGRKLERSVRSVNDSVKMIFETMKHVSTLSAGTMVLSSAIQPHLNPFAQMIVTIGFVALGVSLAIALMSMQLLVNASLFEVAMHEFDKKLMDEVSGKIGWASQFSAISVTSFALGLLLVVCGGIVGRFNLTWPF